MKDTPIQKMVLAALFLALGLVLPLLTGQIKEIGDSLLPMHLPAFLCGILCGPIYGFAVGLSMPFLRSLLFSMPPVYPQAVWMAAELAAYGLLIGLLYGCCRRHSILRVYGCLVAAMIGGRVVWGVAKALLLGIGSDGFTIQMFIAGGFLDAIPGILLQLVLIPLAVELVHRHGKLMQ